MYRHIDKSYKSPKRKQLSQAIHQLWCSAPKSSCSSPPPSCSATCSKQTPCVPWQHGPLHLALQEQARCPHRHWGCSGSALSKSASFPSLGWARKRDELCAAGNEESILCLVWRNPSAVLFPWTGGSWGLLLMWLKLLFSFKWQSYGLMWVIPPAPAYTACRM